MTREIVGTKKQDWGTPRPFFAKINEEYNFTVDVCAAYYNNLLPKYFGDGGVAPDGLRAFWGGEGAVAFCNPPYEAIEDWLAKALREAWLGCKSVFLIPANTDTVWFHEYATFGAIDFIKGRLSFEDLTPPAIEIARLVAAYEKKPAAGLLKAIGLCFNELIGFRGITHEERMRGLTLFTAAPGDDYALRRGSELLKHTIMPEDKRKPGPGFPSMLVTFDPKAAAWGQYRTRKKTGELL